MPQGHDFLATLPPELTLRICCFLDSRSLDNFSHVCRKAYNLLSDGTAWKNAFFQYFGPTKHFGALERSWKAEFLTRSALIQRFHRGRGKSILYDGRIGPIRDVQLDFAFARLVVTNKHNGLVSISNPITGKVNKSLIYPATTRLTSADVTIIGLAKNSIIYGTNTGTIAINNLDRHGRVTAFLTLPSWHEGPVTAICVQDVNSDCDCAIDFITAALDGTVKLWNLGRQRQCLASIEVSEHGILYMNWDSSRDMLYMVSGRQDVFSLDLKGDLTTEPRVVKTLYTSKLGASDIKWSGVAWDLETDSVIIATQNAITRHSTVSSDLPAVSFSCELKGSYCVIAIDEEKHSYDADLPGSGGRTMVIADERGSIAILDTRDVFARPRYVQIEDASITALCVTSTVLAVGCHDGRALLYNVLDAMPLKQLSGLVAEAASIIEHDPARIAVQCIRLLPRHAAGILTIGGHIKSFNYESQNLPMNGKRKGLAGRKHNSRSSLSITNATVRQEIKQGLSDIKDKRDLDERNHQRFEKFTGVLADDMTEEELIAYSKLLSVESATAQDGSSLYEESSAIEDEFQDALQQSRQLYQDELERRDSHVGEEAGPSSTYQEDIDLAIALSRSLT